jgi:outer membrane immunogenic protein
MMGIRIQLASAAAALVALAGSGHAADLRMRVKALPPPVVANWTGWYVGASAGYGWGRADVDPAGVNLFCNPALGGCGPFVIPGGLPADVASVVAIPPVVTPTSRGGLLGGTFGYNQQFGQWVAGLEADFSWASITGSAAATGGPAVLAPGPGGTSFIGFATASNTLQDFGTVRGRLGFTPTPPVLLYATGGLAFGRLTSSAAVTEAAVGPCGLALGCPFTPAAGSSASTHAGWTVGAGGEWAFASQWSLKGEYLYYDIRGTSYGLMPLLSSTGSLTGVAPAPFTSVAVAATTSDFRGSIVRVGLNYKFSSGPLFPR